MKRNYEIEYNTNADQCLIIETQTGYTIRNWFQNDLKIARKELRRLNSGAFFAGFTPEFFARHIPLT